MPKTSLARLAGCAARGHPDAWDRFVRLYAPLFVRWAPLQGFQGADAEDLAQIVLVKLVRLLPGYERRDSRTFRGWLFTICRNEARDFRARPATRAPPGPDGLPTVAIHTPSDDPDEGEYRRHLVRRALELVRPDFAPTTWAAFGRFVFDGRPTPEVARERGVSASAVYLARNRVLTRVREELAGLLD